MGFSKEKIKINNQYLVYNQIEMLKPLFNEIVVVSNNEEFYIDKDVVVVKDIIQKKSPLIGLHAGLTYSSNQINYLIACDMPHIDTDFITYLINGYTSQDALLAKTNGYYEPFNKHFKSS